MENSYIVINGKKAELTEEQLKALGIELPKASPFERVCNHANDFYSYYYIDDDGHVKETVDRGYVNGVSTNDWHYRIGNYCTDREILYQRALHETLNRLLWRYSMTHRDKFYNLHICVKYDEREEKWNIMHCISWNFYPGNIYFDTEEIAQNAIKEVVEPFIAAHPDFKF